MCQLLGMNCNTPTDITFSFSGFSQRAGVTDHHSDGWGIAFFEGRHDAPPDAPDKGVRLFVDHEAASSSAIAQLIRSYPIKSRNVIAHIRKATQGEISLENCHPFVRELMPQLASHGTFNMLLSNGAALWAHASTNLHYIVRQAPFTTAQLSDEDVSIDFSDVTTPQDRVAVIATLPLTTNEQWTAFASGELRTFVDGAPVDC